MWFSLVHCSMRLQLVLCAILIKSHTQLVIRVSYLQTTLRMVGRRIIIFLFTLIYFVRFSKPYATVRMVVWSAPYPHSICVCVYMFAFNDTPILVPSLFIQWIFDLFVHRDRSIVTTKSHRIHSVRLFQTAEIYTQIWNKTGSYNELRFIFCMRQCIRLRLLYSALWIARCISSKLIPSFASASLFFIAIKFNKNDYFIHRWIYFMDILFQLHQYILFLLNQLISSWKKLNYSAGAWVL